MELHVIFDFFANRVDPTMGEIFDAALLAKKDTYSAFKRLRDVVSEERKKISKKGSYRKLCEEYPNHLVLLKMGYFYAAFNDAAEIIGQIMNYKVSLIGGHTPYTGGPDLSIIAESLRSAGLSYIVFNDEKIEDRLDGKNPFI